MKNEKSMQYTDEQLAVKAEQSEQVRSFFFDTGSGLQEAIRTKDKAAFLRLTEYEGVVQYQDYVASDIPITRLYLAAFFAKCCDTAMYDGLPQELGESLKKEMFQKLLACSRYDEFKKLTAVFADRLFDLIPRYSVQSYSVVVQQVLEYIHYHKYQPLSVDEIAEAVHVNRSALSRKFHAETDMTIRDAIHRIKMAAADDLLAQRRYSIDEISDLLGYSSVRQFRKVRKKYLSASSAAEPV